MRLAVFGIGVMVLAGAACGAERPQHVARKAPPVTHATARPVAPTTVSASPRCSRTAERVLTSARASYAGFAPDGAVAYRSPGGAVVARFGRENINGYPTYFAVLGKRVGADCRPLWYRVQLPIRPNGAVGWVRASAIELQPRRPAHRGRRLAAAPQALPVRSTRPRGDGRGRLRGDADADRPLLRQPASRPDRHERPVRAGCDRHLRVLPVLTGWAQGGPSRSTGRTSRGLIGHAVSNGCIRLPNDTLERLFKIVPPARR